MAAPNPLVAERVDSTQWYSGIGLADSIADLSSGVSNGSWVEGIIGGFGTTMETLGLVFDPLGTIVSWGIAWLMDHVKPLSDALDWLAGDGDQVRANANTWKNVAAFVKEDATRLWDSVQRDVAEWTGTAAETYLAHAAQHREALRGMAEGADTVGTIVEACGFLVSTVRDLVRDLIADFISVLAVRIWEWIAIAAGTLGLGTPWVIAQVSTLVGQWGAKIARLLNGLVSSFRKLAPIISKLDELIKALQDMVRRLSRAGGGSHLDDVPHRQTGGEIRRPRNDGDFWDNWADEAYDGIRRSDTDIDDIARHTEDYGLSRSDIEQIKNHVFHEEHLLDSYDAGSMGRFDANPRMAEAWQRLQEGRPHPADIDLLRHELFESNYMRDHGPSYKNAHQATIDAGHTWDPDAAAGDGLGYQSN